MYQKPSLGVRFLLGLVSFLLCVCLFFSAIAAILIMDVRAVASKDNLESVVSEILFSPVATRQIPARGTANTGVGAAIRQSNLHLAATKQLAASPSQDDGSIVVQWAYEFVNQQLGEDSPLTYEHVEKFFEESTVKDFVTDKVASILNDYYTGESTTSITSQEIRELVNENRALIQEHFNITITDENLDTAVAWVETSGVADMISVENIDSLLGAPSGTSVPQGAGSVSHVMDSIANGGEGLSLSAIMAAVRYLTSNTILLAVLGVCVLLIGLLMLTNCKRIYLGFIDSGIAIILAGVLMLIPAVLSGLLSGIFSGSAGKILQQLLAATGPVGGIAVAIGAALLAAGIVIYSIRKSNMRKAMLAAAAAPEEVVPVVVTPEN